MHENVIWKSSVQQDNVPGMERWDASIVFARLASMLTGKNNDGSVLLEGF